MKISFISGYRLSAALLTLAVSFAVFLDCPRLQAQSQTINGDLGVTGSLDISGGTFNFGAWATDTTKPGLGLAYTEDASHASLLTLTMTRPVSGWLWQQAAPGGGTGFVPQMRLSSGNALTLYNQAAPTPVATIVLDPVGTSTFGTSVTFSGTNNLMPNQTLTGSASVLTLGLADARYLPQGNGTNISLGSSALTPGSYSVSVGYDANASGAYSNALGTITFASGDESTAIGFNATASADVSSAIGFSTLANASYSTAVGMEASAFQSYAVAMGCYVNATGANSCAIGQSSTATNYLSSALGIGSGVSGMGASALALNSAATGDYSMALGAFSLASGAYSTALTSSSSATGDYSVAAGQTQATSLYQLTAGAYALPGGDAHNWVATDDLFTVGNGQSATAPSNALSVKKNGDTSVSGNLTVAKAIIVQPQGDLSMGEFTAQPSPSPTP